MTAYNQPEVNSVDTAVWRKEKYALYDRVGNFCRQNNVEFISQFITLEHVRQTRKKKIVFMFLFDLLLGQEFWQQVNEICEQDGKQVFVATDNVLTMQDLPRVKFFSFPELLGITDCYDTVPVPNPKPSRLYNCFMQRVDSVRQSWFYFLHLHGLLDQGYVSYLMKTMPFYSELTGKDLFDFIHEQYELGQLPHFEQAYQALRDQVPYRNFEEIFDLADYLADSKYSLTFDTNYGDDDSDRWCFTEKILRAMQFPNYVLPILQKGSVGVLKSLGFQFNLDLDHLDQMSWQERQTELLNFLIQDPVDFDYERLYNVSRHNQDLIRSWKKQYQQPDFFDDFYNAVLAA
jgi:hypothetical protein